MSGGGGEGGGGESSQTFGVGNVCRSRALLVSQIAVLTRITHIARLVLVSALDARRSTLDAWLLLSKYNPGERDSLF